MRQAFLIRREGKEQHRVPVGGSMVIGRAAECDLVLDDPAASRQHFEIRVSNGDFQCRDLGSKNGTKVNGARTVACELKHGDRIDIGDTSLRFEFGDAAELTAPEKTVFLQTAFDPAGEIQRLAPATRSKELLEAAYTLMNAIASNFNPCELVDTILHTTMEAIHAQRGAILLAGPDAELQPCGVCGCVHTIRDGVARAADVDEINISESVARRVVERGENVLYQFARTDGQIDPSVSIRALNLTSILCVPIRTQNNVFGILYIDTDLTDHEYTEDDLLLAAAAGNSAGLALENARIHQSLLESHRIEQEIADAWTIQEGFLVKDWPEDEARFEVYGETLPAKKVGGDFYDFVRLDSDTVGVLIGDVSGKGVPASLTMAQMLAEFRVSAQEAESPSQVLSRLNRRLIEHSRRGTFCTMCYVMVDLVSGRLVGANAGHHPMLVASDGATRDLFGASGPPIGVLPDVEWQDESASLRPGETMLMYTDGIIEARSGATQNGSDETILEYQMDRLRVQVQKQYADGPRSMIRAVIQDVHRFTAPLSPHDDCTMIALRFAANGA
jgi:serine phosphatase RsbU (regulator of sigma subunit)